MTGSISPVVVVGHRGAWFTAADGSTWLDAATGGFGAADRVRARIDEQLSRIALSSRVLLSRPLADAVRAIDRLCPDPLTVSYLCNSGDEALDAALKLAKGTHPERRLVLGFAGEDFGQFVHGLALRRGRPVLPGQALEPISAPRADPDRLVRLVSTDVAAVVVAPAAPGRRLADLPVSWWVRLRGVCDRWDVPLILDERLTGPARLGAGLGVHRLGIVPDGLVLGSALGADVIPVGCLVSTRRAYDRVYEGRNPTLHGSTFAASPLSAAAVTATLTAVADEGLAERQLQVQDGARRAFGSLGGAVSGFGADGSLVWLHLPDDGAAAAVAAELRALRVLVRPPEDGVLAVLPPLTADAADVAELLDRVVTAVKRVAGATGATAA